MAGKLNETVHSCIVTMKYPHGNARTFSCPYEGKLLALRYVEMTDIELTVPFVEESLEPGKPLPGKRKGSSSAVFH